MSYAQTVADWKLSWATTGNMTSECIDRLNVARTKMTISVQTGMQMHGYFKYCSALLYRDDMSTQCYDINKVYSGP